jgi:hypothetical protein
MAAKDKTVGDAQQAPKAVPAATPDDNAAQTVKDTGAKAGETPDPKTYTANQDVYVGGRYYKAGSPFTTADEPAEFWKEVDPETAAIDKASLNKIPGDAPLEGMELAALQAVAATKHIDTTGMDKDQLITAIKAANEPAL